jgi:hypothetical protein
VRSVNFPEACSFQHRRFSTKSIKSGAPQFPTKGLLDWNNFRSARDPSRIDAKRGDHFPQADFTLLIAIRDPNAERAHPRREILVAAVKCLVKQLGVA